MSATSPKRNSYDAIVVGAGLGGLVAAAYLAKFGLSTLLLDRNDGPGGYAHAFRRGPYLIDPAVHVVPQAKDGDTVDALLRFLGVRNEVAFQHVPTLYRLVADGFSFEAPAGLDAFADALCDAFPSERTGIRDFCALCMRYVEEARQMPIQMGMGELGDAVERFPTVFEHRTATLGAVLERYIRDDRCIAALTAIWVYVGLPPSRLAFEIFARFLVTLGSGYSHVVGGCQKLVDAFVGALEATGGEFLPNAEVTRIRVSDGRVRGVTVRDELEVDAPVVLSNADGRHTFEQLVGLDLLPASYQRRLQRLRPSSSMFVVYAATTLQIDADATPFQMMVFSDFNLDAAYEAMMAGRPGTAQVIIPSLHDDAFTPPGEHLVVAASLASYDASPSWPERKDDVQTRVLELANRALPDLCEHLTHVESATPLALERYSGNYKGAAAGWENAPDQSASRRLPYISPIEGLYLAGQWTQAASSFRVMVSGTHAAQIILRKAGVEDVGPMF